MDGHETPVPDTTPLRQALTPRLLPQFVRILAHVQEMRAWATQTTVLAAAEREALLAQLAGLEQVAETLAADYAALQTPMAPTPET